MLSVDYSSAAYACSAEQRSDRHARVVRRSSGTVSPAAAARCARDHPGIYDWHHCRRPTENDVSGIKPCSSVIRCPKSRSRRAVASVHDAVDVVQMWAALRAFGDSVGVFVAALFVGPKQVCRVAKSFESTWISRGVQYTMLRSILSFGAW